jgi:hypothetical protein
MECKFCGAEIKYLPVLRIGKEYVCQSCRFDRDHPEIIEGGSITIEVLS